MRLPTIFLIVSTLSFPAAAASWETMALEQLCQSEPARIERLFTALDTSLPGLGAVEHTVTAKDYPAACRALLAYYEDRFKDQALPVSETPRSPSATAEAIIKREFTFYKVTDTVPLLANGGLDWTHQGPAKDPEWAWGLCRHSHMGSLLRAYRNSGEERFVTELDRHLRDFILHNPYPGEKTNGAQWRGLETALRMHTWTRIFERLQNHPRLTPVARILMLSALPDHAHYSRNFHSPTGNWLTMEMNGLSTIALTWPELKASEAWISYAVQQMTLSMGDQVYPDGIQTELTSHYHRVSLWNFERFMDKMVQAKVTLPAVYRNTVESMWNYLAYSMRPDGHSVLNNDGDYNDSRGEVLPAAGRYQRPDWRYIATNGRKGASPKEGPSIFFPWAGEAILRSGWEADADWAFFDVGPLGTGHYHRDKLHLSIQAHGRDLLVDSGRYTYVSGPWREYFINTRAHNTLLIDDCLQNKYTSKSDAPLTKAFKSTPDYDFVQGTFNGGYNQLNGSATHTRTVVYLRNQYWLVFDRIDSDRPRKITALWNFHPNCTVEQAESTVYTTDADQGNILVAAITPGDWKVACIKGQEDPVQGWYSEQYSIKEPATTARFTRNVPAQSTVAWLLVPKKGAASSQGTVQATVEALDKEHARIHVGTKENTHTLTVDFQRQHVSISTAPHN